jgi:hypothetical protein
MTIEIVPGKQLLVSCPYCNKVGVITMDKDVVGDGMLDRGDSMVPMRVFQGDICEHEFMVTLDVNFKVR